MKCARYYALLMERVGVFGLMGAGGTNPLRRVMRWVREDVGCEEDCGVDAAARYAQYLVV